MSSKRNIMFAIAGAVGVLAFPGAAGADTASTPVGQLTATQYSCDHPGALVTVSVASGLANKTYTAVSPPGYHQVSKTFTTNASGVGSANLVGVWPNSGPISNPDGVATITVTANGQTGSVSLYVYCPSDKGD